MAEVKAISPVDPAQRTEFPERKDPKQPERKLNPRPKPESKEKPNPLDKPMPAEGDPEIYRPDTTITPQDPKKRDLN